MFVWYHNSCFSPEKDNVYISFCQFHNKRFIVICIAVWPGARTWLLSPLDVVSCRSGDGDVYNWLSKMRMATWHSVHTALIVDIWSIQNNFYTLLLASWYATNAETVKLEIRYNFYVECKINFFFGAEMNHFLIFGKSQ